MMAVTNTRFLQGCFDADWQDAHVTGFAEDPGKLEALGLRSAWMGWKWKQGAPAARVALPDQNAYFTISTFDAPPDGGRARRTKALFQACHVIVIDDVGTKVPVSNVPVELAYPSWKLETSPGNFQWGYVLDTPERDAGRATTLLDGMVAAGLCPDGKDPGMRGVTRYVRLPEGVNSKAKYGLNGFRHVLHEWAPKRKIGIEELARPFGIVLPPPGSAPSAPMWNGARIGAKDDTIFGLLDRRGMVAGRAADGVGYLIECPWMANHTGRDATGAAYWPGGGFQCFHGHCDTRGRGELRSWADAELRKEFGVGLAALDFKDADKPQIDAFFRVLAAGRVPSRDEIAGLSAVPGRHDVAAMLRAANALLGTNTGPITRALRNEWTRSAGAAAARKRTADQPEHEQPVALPDTYTAPVPLAEAQADMASQLAALFDGGRQG